MKPIKPCPFCGCKPTIYQSFDTDKNQSESWYTLECLNQNCPVIVCTCYQAKTEEEAIEMWNKRYKEGEPYAE